MVLLGSKVDDNMLKNKNIVIGITGGIACYKVCEIISYLVREGANVDVIMTKNATEFITPLTIENLSKNKVVIDMFDKNDNIITKRYAFINPRIISHSTNKAALKGGEGCLSVNEDKTGYVYRYYKDLR